MTLSARRVSRKGIGSRMRVHLILMATSDLTTKEQLTSIWDLGGQSVWQFGKRVWSRMNSDDIFGRAAQLAYNFFLAAFPLLLFMLSIFGLLASRGTALRDQLFGALSQAMPPSAYQLVSQTVNDVVRSTGGGKSLLGALLFLWSATAGTTTMMSVLNAAYHVQESRPFYKVRPIALGLTLALCVLVSLSLALVLFGGQAAEAIAGRIGLGSIALIAWKVVQWVLALLALSLTFSLIYYFGPDIKEQHWYWITPGSLIGVVLWFVAAAGFRIYLHYFNTYGKTYGSLGAVIILLLWFYVTGLVFLLGGEINAEIEHAAAKHGHPEAKAPGEKKAA